ncbi:hypothetical protein MPPM_1175 [Methylorubrum populi]|uniref:Uncharacterized protein n=1 Tax=Methylorubrum populi TaxID=223967 RepID=A0A160PEN4_9HYPH|nr:hypothetical protein [Methylorubrum populi]BAU89780.1 hypothetical protein MPPM_1175 [Methylorubrum populi]
MLATWLAALVFFGALQALLVVKLADRLTLSGAPQDCQPVCDPETKPTAGRYARAA